MLQKVYLNKLTRDQRDLDRFSSFTYEERYNLDDFDFNERVKSNHDRKAESYPVEEGEYLSFISLREMLYWGCN